MLRFALTRAAWAAVFVACSTSPPAIELGPEHPASPMAAETPSQPASRTLDAAPVEADAVDAAPEAGPHHGH